jgi:hypothetical protein
MVLTGQVFVFRDPGIVFGLGIVDDGDGLMPSGVNGDMLE